VKRSALLTKFLVAFLAVAMLFTATSAPKPASAQSIGISVNFGPPPIPYYVQPPAPDQNMIWSPGYWGYDPADGYYWVPGTWVPAPQVGLLWTPGFWGWNGIAFIWSSGYWGTQVGWYGGVDYGYGYYGHGYYGGRWNHDHFVYNTAITNVNRNVIRNVYSDPRVAMHNWNRTSFNGGRGGIAARPSSGQLAAAHGRVSGPTNVQMQHARYAATNRASFAAVNHGRPATAAVARPYSTAFRGSQRMTAPQRNAAPQHATAMEAHRAPVQHAYAPQQHAAPQERHVAPVQHAYAPQQHAAPQEHRAAPVQHYAAPQAHYAAPVQRAAPVQHVAAPQAHYAAPVQRAAPAQHMAAPQQHAARPAPAAGQDDHHDHP
jgi:hypothetical protein